MRLILAGPMSYEYLEREARTHQRLVGKGQQPLTTETFLNSSVEALGAVPGSNPELDSASPSGRGQRRPRGPDPASMADKVAGVPTPALKGFETDHTESKASTDFISARGRMGKGRASPERDPAPGTVPAGFSDFRHTWELRGVRSAEQEALIPSDHLVQRETGLSTWTPQKDGSRSPLLELPGEAHVAPVTLERQDVGKLSSMSPWQRPGAQDGGEAGGAEASWRQTGRPDVEPTSPQSRLSGSPTKRLPHMAASSDSPWSPGQAAEPAAEAASTGTGADDDYFRRQALRDELLALNIKALRERAAAAGVDKALVENAIDLSEDPKRAVIGLIVDSTDSTAREVSFG